MNDKEIKKFLEEIGFSEDTDIDGKHGQKGSYQMTISSKIRISHLELECLENRTKENILNLITYHFVSESEFFTKRLKGILSYWKKNLKI